MKGTRDSEKIYICDKKHSFGLSDFQPLALKSDKIIKKCADLSSLKQEVHEQLEARI